MIFTDHLKVLDKLWDKIAKARLPKKLKAVLLVIVTIAILIDSFWLLLLIKQVTDVISVLLV